MLKCEICGKSDVPTMVVSSGYGPMSLSTCVICSPMNAVTVGIAEYLKEDCGMELSELGACVYDQNTDTYKDENNNIVPIELSNGDIFKRRGDYVKMLYDRYPERFKSE